MRNTSIKMEKTVDLKCLLVLFSILVAIASTAQPVITSFTPATGPTGTFGTTIVTINGSGFSTTPGNNIVFFGAVYAAATTATATQLTVTAPAGVTGKYLSVVNTETGLSGSIYSQNPFFATYSNEGSMIFSSTATFSYTDAFKVPYFKMADIDGDGKADIVHVDSSKVKVLKNLSTPGNVNFDTTNFYATPNIDAGNSIVGLDIGDLTGDGKPEIVISCDSPTNANIKIYPNLSTPGTVNLGTYFHYGLGSVILGKDINMTDFDKDGKTDIVVPRFRESDGAVTVMKNEYSAGSGFALSAITYSTPVSISGRFGEVTNLTAADFDNDNLVDIGIVFHYYSYDSNFVNIVYNNSSVGNISFASHSEKITLGLGEGSAISDGKVYYAKAIDMDGDGKPDITSSNFQASNITTLLNLGTRGVSNLATRVGVSIGPASGPSALAVGDLDGDGKPDLVASGSVSNNFVVQRNNAVAGNIRVAARRSFPVITLPMYLEICDVDGDGLPDIIVCSKTNLAVYKGELKKDKLVPAKLPF